MTKDRQGHLCGRRIATSDGAMLADPVRLGNAEPELFEPSFWAARGELVEVTAGRGSAWFIARVPVPWALRHYRRGGLIARLSQDRYVWGGEERVRSFAEWRLLAALAELGLPVPRPVAARYQRAGFVYRCDLITERISGAYPLSSVLARHALEAATWHAVGAAIARFHAAGVDHADLNAHNILLDDAGAGGGERRSVDAIDIDAGADGGERRSVHILDFDRGRLRGPCAPSARPCAWMSRNLSRLRRSLLKISRVLPGGRFSAAEWGHLLGGYGAARERALRP